MGTSAAVGVSSLCSSVGLSCDVVSTVCFADPSIATDIAHVRRLAQLCAGAVVILLADGTTIMAPTVDAVSVALLFSAQMFPFAACGHAAIIPFGMKAGNTGAVVTDLTGYGNGCFPDFLCDLA